MTQPLEKPNFLGVDDVENRCASWRSRIPLITFLDVDGVE